jgi:tRNA1(Val) A37 N6-methylase TrmN6
MDLQRSLLEQEAAQIRLELLNGLEKVAQSEVDPTQRLFAEDTARGLKLLEILSKRYDTVVMNPPYGAPTSGVRDLLKTMYPLTWNDIYATFIDRGTQLVEPHGYVGALVSSTFVNLASFENLRTQILLARNPLVVMLDLGRGILDDANVATAALVMRGTA